MAYQYNSGPSSQQPALNSNNSSRDAAPPSYQSNPYNEFQDEKVPLHFNQADDNFSKLSSEDGHEPNDDDILAQATEFTRHVQPPAYTPSALSKPVAIPQTVAGTGKAFARCWSPALTPYNITESDFVEFIDNLNVVATANPPLQILGLVGGALGIVPLPFFGLAGLGVQVFAKLGTYVVSKSRTDSYMKAVNKDFFSPRGLKVTIVNRDAMALSLGLPDGVGKLAPITDENIDKSMLERRLEGMKPYLSELRFDVPPPVQQTTVLAKMSAMQVQRQTSRIERRVMKKRQKQMERMEKVTDKLHEKGIKMKRKYEKEMAKLDEDVKKAQRHAEKDLRKGGHSAEKAGLKLMEELAEIEEERKVVESEFAHIQKESDGMCSKEASLKGDKESKNAMKALWILIENLEDSI